jgi:hypothetical protein
MPVYVLAWRAVIAGLAWWGLLAALKGDLTALKYFSQVSTATVALSATASVLGFGIVAPRWDAAMAWCRGAATTYAIITAVIYRTVLEGDLPTTSSVLEHLVVPALAVIDWVVFGAGRVRQRWWTPLTWLIIPAGYLGVYYFARNNSGKALYAFLNPGKSNFWTWVGILLVVFILIGFLVWGVGVGRSALARRRAARAVGG